MNFSTSLFILLLSVLWNRTVAQDETNTTASSGDFDSERVETNLETNEKRSYLGSEEDGWSLWSEWSVCSRSCDGGVTTQLRKCERKAGCSGASVKYRICNMQPCPDFLDFRATQCTAYNNIPYRGRFYEWLPFYDPEDPCSLTCQARTFNFVAKLAPKVLDGTRCREGALDMCVGGNCLTVGCDLQLGSTKRIDDCGICGGDGSSCRKPVYAWGEPSFSPCSVTCGGGYQVTKVACRDKDTDNYVDERLCDFSMKPQAEVKECNTQKCPAQWVTEPWGPCTQPCGGRQLRLVYCTQAGVNGTKVRVSDHHCPKQKPLKEKPCGVNDCPIWFEGPWSPCSKSCGTGYQTRAVVCKDSHGTTSDACNPTSMPLTKQPCSNHSPCKLQSADMVKDPQEDAPPQMYPQMYAAFPWTQKLISPSSSVSSEPSFVAGEWGACNVTCGEGVRFREVSCKILLDFSKTVASLPDVECSGEKPNLHERCFPRPCALGQNKEMQSNHIPNVGIEVTYTWVTTSFTPCTAFCLGGIRESIVECVRDHDHAVVNHYLCDITRKPQSITQTCNDIPCPPRWNISEFTYCPKTCGGGIQTREVQCIHELTRGTLNTMIVNNSKCPDPKPRTHQFCNVVECPARWHPEPWSKCSKSCGGGLKTRKIKCQKERAYGQVLEQQPSRCPKRRPRANKPCNKKPCDVMAPPKSEIYASRNLYTQESPQSRVSLKVGGRAIVFKGTNVKIRCPSKKGNKTQILWFKNKKLIESSKKYRITRKGTLRIRRISYGSSGIYSCAIGKSKAEININVKPLPSGYVISEEDKTVERTRKPTKNNPELLTEEEVDYSHEYHHVPKANKESRRGNKSHITVTKIRPYKHPNLLDRIDQSSDEKYGSPRLINYYNIDRNSTRSKVMVKSGGFLRPLEPVSTQAVASQEDSRTVDTWENQHGGTLFSDQDSGELNAGTPHHGKGFIEDEQPAKSGAASHLPHIQQLLVNLHSTLGGPALNRRMPDTYEDDEPIRGKPGMPPMMGTNSFILGKGTAENLEFDWMTTEWTPCSQPCGGTGLQVRTVECLVRLNNISKPVDKSLCDDAGLKPPINIQKCGWGACPFWGVGPWGPCRENQCFTWQTSIQERNVYCQLLNRTVVENKFCDPKTEPPSKQECVQEKCKGTWVVGEWSKCTVSCGENGFQTRILQCVWYGTKNPAGNACRDQPRPSVMKHCKGPPCYLESQDQIS